MSLQDEPGIPELKQLYYDVFDYNLAKFTSMSKKSEEEYNKDLATFYQAFTGKQKLPVLLNHSVISNCATLAFIPTARKTVYSQRHSKVHSKINYSLNMQRN